MSPAKIPRWEHTLSPNHRRSIPRNWVFFDVENLLVQEGDSVYMPFQFGYALHWRYDNEASFEKYQALVRFDSPQHFLQIVSHLAKGGKTLYLCAHNVAHDICSLDLLSLLVKEGWEVTSLYEEQNTVIIRLKREKQRICILDSMNWFRGSLGEFAALVGMEKIEVDFANPDPDLLDKRCQTDVVILWKMVAGFIRFVLQQDLGSVRLTAASQAFAAYRHRFYKIPIRIHANEEVLALERAGYGGGMVRCWRVGEFAGKFYHLDVNSLYPYWMRQGYYPIRLKVYRNNVGLEELSHLVRRFCVMADLTIHPQSPMFPHRCENGVIIYPCYPFRGVFATPEVDVLLKKGWISEVHRVAFYLQGNIFHEYVDKMYALRKKFRREGNRIYEYLCKLMLNSLYGKFGAKSKRLVQCEDFAHPGPLPDYWYDPQAYALRPIYYFNPDPNVPGYVLVDEGEGFNSFPAISAHVTAYGRLFLYRLVEEAGVENVFYSDTDSLIVNEEGAQNLSRYIHPEEIGFLKVVGEADHIIVRGRKDYQFGERKVLKGVPEPFRVYDRNETVREVWPSIRGFYGVKPPRQYAIRRQNVHLSRRIWDGWIGEKGTVSPYEFPPDYDTNPHGDPLAEYLAQTGTGKPRPLTLV